MPATVSSSALFDTVLIANRGEIACRIIRTLRSLGIRSVAVYSDADAGARHVHLADVAVRLGPAAAAESYLNQDAVLRAAALTGAQAIHPGYGFLAENASFAEACEAAGIVFVGPDSRAIAVMGDKISAKATVEARGVATVPGIARPGLTDDELTGGAIAVGFPVLIKPSAGGGGKGMHVVEDADGMPAALAAARREARASFGDDTLFVERYISAPRHIEVQVLADAHGTVVHLGERECSLQRRHQKVIEEAPSPLLDAATRARIGTAACETARSVGYRGAGTVEFIVSAEHPDEFFFMEMNTRLQVEHPVTEQVTGFDLVELQLRIAAGEPLPFAQDDVRIDGHSFEARVYAEDPAAGFLPTGGHVDLVRHPSGEGIRVDTALEDDLTVSIDYDPMLAKIISWAPTREDARARLVAALERTAVLGVTTNVEFLARLLELPDVVTGDLDTGLIARELDGIRFAVPDARNLAEAALLLAREEESRVGGSGPWSRRDGWRLGTPAHRTYRFAALAGESHRVLVGGETSTASAVTAATAASPASAGTGSAGTAATVQVDDGPEWTATVRTPGDEALVTVDGRSRSIPFVVTGRSVVFADRGATFTFDAMGRDRAATQDVESNPQLLSPMPGTVVLLPVADGDEVGVGDPVAVVEAMKMEHVLRAEVAGTVHLHAELGAQVARGQVIADIRPPLPEE